MCGINGFNFKDKEKIQEMNRILRHRGPDGSDIYVDDNVSLAHNRLSIIDLSNNGSQPMEYKHGQKEYIIIFNGEIYNYLELKNDLLKRGHSFNSNSDTEVILACYAEYGASCVDKFNGMWAFVIYDLHNNILFCSRDRLGIKPFYYYAFGKRFIFSSEMKVILMMTKTKELDPSAISDLFNYRVILGEKTLLKDIKKLQPGTNLFYDLKTNELKINKYWSINYDKDSLIKDEKRIIKDVKDILETSVKYRLIADVPVQVSLSGGLDSSIITAIASKFNKDLTAYTIGFNKKGDEIKEAQETAKLLGINHETIYVDLKKIDSDLNFIIKHLEEPVADPAIFPAYYIYREAVKKAKVLLLGEGSDELFSGYMEYKLFSIPAPEIIRNRAFKYLRKPFKKSVPIKVKSQKIHYSGDLNQYLLNDVTSILPNFQLLRVDKLSMANSLECRVPFLDHRLVELAFRIPAKLKLKGFTGKHILREVAKEYLPKSIIDRNKKTFFSPLDIIEKTMTRDLFEYSKLKRLNDIIDYDSLQHSLVSNSKNLKKQDVSSRTYRRQQYELFIWWLIEKEIELIQNPVI